LALAHPKIITTDPPADAQLATSPKRVRIEFNEAIEQTFAGLQVFNAQSQPVDSGDGGRSADNPALLSVSLPELPPGIYTVVWQAVGSDGHHVKGFFAFRVLASANEQSSPTSAITVPTSQTAPTSQIVPTIALVPSMPDEQPEPAIGWGAFLRACMLLGSFLTLGGWVFLFVILGPLRTNTPEMDRTSMLRIRRMLVAGMILMLLAIPAFLIIQTSSIAGRVDLTSMWLTLTATRLGLALAARTLIAIALLAVLLFRKPVERSSILAFVLGGGMLLTFTLSGHASVGSSPLLPMALDWLHLVATAVWIGGLIAFVLVLPLPTALLGPTIARFSSMALACVAILTASGIYAATLHLTAVSDLWLSDYGRTLLAKLILFGITIAFGAYHLLIVRPHTLTRIAHAATSLTDWQQRFQVSLRGEALVAILIVGTVGLLTSQPLPDAQPASAAAPVAAIPATALPIVGATAIPVPTRTPAPIVPFVGEQAAADVRVALRVEPAALGANTLHVTVMDANGTPRDVQRIQMTLDMQAMDMGETKIVADSAGNGAYEVKQQWLSMVGTWRVQVVVRRSDADDVTVTFMVPVGG
jgi:copper transport protein